MGKLDFYIIKKFLGTFFYMIIAFTVIAIVFDVSEKIDDLITNEAPMKEILFDYYMNFTFFLGNLLSSILVFLTVILVTSGMAQKSEIVAILSSGVSYRRMLLPYFVAAGVLVFFSLIIAHSILPRANETRLSFEEKYIYSSFRITEENLHREIEPGVIAYFQSITASKNVGYKFSIEHWDDNHQLRKKLIASKATYIPEEDKWEIINAQIREISPEGVEKISRFNRIDTTINLKISDFGQRLEVAAALGDRELNEYIEQEKQKGSDQVVFLLIEKYSRTSNGFAIFILTLIGVTISSRKSRGGTGLHMAAGVVIGFVYIFAMKLSAVSATNAGVPPIIAVWIPNVLFLFIGIYLYRKAPK